MGLPWAEAFALAAVVTLAGTPGLRRIALATEFVDRPGAHKSHHRPTPYLGGIGLIVAVLLSLLSISRVTAQVGVIALGGSLIGCLGLLDDHRSIDALPRLLVELAVAVVALAAGLRVHFTDVALIDDAITLAWIAGVTNAVNLLDNMDGLAAGVAAAAALAIFTLAILGEQLVTATIAAGLAGACIGFLAHNKRPASIFMGDTGSLFLGFVLAVATIGVNPALAPPASFAVPVMLLALPVLDTTVVTVSRLRHGRSISQGGRDHLSHRLVALGLSGGTAVLVLVAVEGAVGVLAVLAGRGVVPLGAAVLAVAAVLGGLTAVTATAPVYVEPVIGLPRRLQLAAAGAISVAAVAAAPAVVAVLRAQQPGAAGAAAMRQGLAALAAGDASGANALFGRAERDFDRAGHTLAGPMTSVGLAFPGLRVNLAAARVVASVGHDVAAAASDLSAVAGAASLHLDAAADPGARAAALAPALSASATVLRTSGLRLVTIDRPYLWPSLARTMRGLQGDLIRQGSAAERAAGVAREMPALLGTGGSRRYFLAVQDNAELRGGGGVIHLWGELRAAGGRLTLDHLGPIEELDQPAAGAVPAPPDLPADFVERYRPFDVSGTWQNVNVSPDFVTTGEVITSLYVRSGRGALDGVVAVDLRGLAALLDVVGPVPVQGWPRPVASASLATDTPIDDSRQDALARLVTAAVSSLSQRDLGTPARVAASLAGAAAGGHLQLYATDPAEEQFAASLGIAGAVPSVTSDALMVVNQNLSATTVDRFLSRHVRYDATLHPGRERATLTGRLEVTLRNTAPASGLPRAAIGPHDDRFSPGENRTYLSVYTPLALKNARIDGRAATVESHPELGRQSYSSIVAVPPLGSRTASFDLGGEVRLSPGNWYQLDLLHQPSLAADEAEVAVSVPKGWRIVEARGMRLDGSRRAVATLRVDNHEQLAVRVERTTWSRLWHPTGG